MGKGTGFPLIHRLSAESCFLSKSENSREFSDLFFTSVRIWICAAHLVKTGPYGHGPCGGPVFFFRFKPAVFVRFC